MAALSPRERQVLEGIVSGKPNKQIAYDLKISVRTVEGTPNPPDVPARST